MSQYEKIKDSFEKESFRYAMDVFIIKVLNDLKSRNSAENQGPMQCADTDPRLQFHNK